MVITDVELLVVEKQPGQELVLLTVKTDAGIKGHSMGWGIRGGKRLAPPLDIPIAGVEWAAGRYH